MEDFTINDEFTIGKIKYILIGVLDGHNGAQAA